MVVDTGSFRYHLFVSSWTRSLAASTREIASSLKPFLDTPVENRMGTGPTAKHRSDLLPSWNRERFEPQLVCRSKSGGFQHWATQSWNHELHSHCSWAHPRGGLFRRGAHRRNLCWADHQRGVEHTPDHRPSWGWSASLSCWSRSGFNVSLVIGVVMGLNWGGLSWLAAGAVASVCRANKDNHCHDRDDHRAAYGSKVRTFHARCMPVIWWP